MTLGGASVPFEIKSSNTITAIIALDTRSGPISVSTPGGIIISTNLLTVLPRILSFAPTLGPVGTQVTIMGTSFFDVSSVSFNGTKSGLTFHSPEEIVTTVPVGATTGPIQVTTPDGTATSGTNFVVTSTSDLFVSKAISQSLAAPGETLSYSNLVENRGPSTVTDLTLTDTLPADVRLLSINSPRAVCSTTNRIITCNLGVLTNGDALQITMQTRFDLEGAYTNRITVRAAEPDLNPSNNAAEAVVVIASELSRRLQIQRVASTNVIVITWPLSPVNFALQSIDSLGGTWQPVLTVPTVVRGQNRITTEANGPERFYRLTR